MLLLTLLAKLIIGVPRMALNAVGLGFRSKFEVGGRRVERPKHFSSRAHKAAFESVADYVGDALARDIMVIYLDRELARDHILRPSGVPVEVWHEVLAYFAEQGLIVARWQLRLPPFDREPASPRDWRVPSWSANGDDIEDKPKRDVFGGTVPDSAPFMPGLLTEDQRSILLGAPYALTATANLGWQKAEQRYVTLSEGNFTRVYFRDRSILTEKETRAAASKLAAILTL